MHDTLDRLMTIDEAVERYPHLSREELMEACRRERIGHIRYGRKRLVTPETIDQYVAAKQEMPAIDRDVSIGRAGFIYFVGFGPYVKIGYAGAGVEGRVASLQTACPERLIVYAITRGYREQECELHARFAEYRTYGEWFRLEGRVLALVEKMRGRPIGEAGPRENAR